MRSKRWLLLGIALAGGLALYGATQIWVTLSLSEGAAAFGWLFVTGQQLNQSLSPVAIAAIAAALALSIAGRGFRKVLGVLVALLGIGVAAIGWSVLKDPVAAAASRLTEVTGLAGSSQLDLIEQSQVTPFIAVTIAAGVLLVILGGQVVLFGGSWKSAGRKYEADQPKSEQDEGEPDRISDWDSMNDGADPSERPRG